MTKTKTIKLSTEQVELLAKLLEEAGSWGEPTRKRVVKEMGWVPSNTRTPNELKHAVEDALDDFDHEIEYLLGDLLNDEA